MSEKSIGVGIIGEGRFRISVTAIWEYERRDQQYHELRFREHPSGPVYLGSNWLLW